MAQVLTMTTRNKTKNKRGTLTDAIARGEYSPDPKLRLPERTAHFLDWAAKAYPKSYAPYNYVLKAIMGYDKTPRLDTEEVLRVRGNISRVRAILQEKYGRDLDTVAQVGVRATVDDADTLTVALPKKVRRLDAARQSVSKTAALIDPARLPTTADLAPWKRWLTTDVRTVLKTIEAPEFARRMLPPGSNDEGDG